MAIAGMYSREFLSAQRTAVMNGVSGSDVNTLSILFGDSVTFEQVEVMSHQSFFAHQLLHVEQSTPKDLLMRVVEIGEETPVNETEVRMSVVLTGMEADPNYREEELMSFVFEENLWKIKH